MAEADLYLDTISIETYLSRTECKKCGADSCRDLVEKLKQNECSATDLSSIPPFKLHALQSMIDIEKNLPAVPRLQLPRPSDPGLTELNNPSNGDPILVTGNNLFTQEVLMCVLASTTKPLFFLSTDTQGDSLDMAVILGTFTVDTVLKALTEEGLSKRGGSSPLLIPGRAGHLAEAIHSASGCTVDIGPICAVELPLYFSSAW